MASLNSRRLVTRTIIFRSQNETEEAVWAYSSDHEKICVIIPGAPSRYNFPDVAKLARFGGLRTCAEAPSFWDFGTGTVDGIAYVASATRVVGALSGLILLTHIKSFNIPVRLKREN